LIQTSDHVMLLSVVEKILLASIGDLLLDVVVVPNGEIRPNDDTPSTVRVGGPVEAAREAVLVAARAVTRLGGRP